MRSILVDHTFMELADLGAPNNAAVNTSDIIDRLLQSFEDDYASKNEARNAIDEFLRFCAERTEVFVPAAAEDTFKFFHRSFYEYFYAKYIVRRLHSAEELYSAFCKIDLDSEVFELATAMIKNDDMHLCINLINLLCEKANDDLNSLSPSFHELNILGLIMPLISNRRCIERLIDVLCNNNQIIDANRTKIVVNSQLAQLVCKETEYVDKIKRIYRDHACEDVLKHANEIVTAINELTSQGSRFKVKFDFTSMCKDLLDGNLAFYSKVLLAQYDDDYIALLKDMQNHWLKQKYGDSKNGRKQYSRICGHLHQLMRWLQETESSHATAIS